MGNGLYLVTKINLSRASETCFLWGGVSGLWQVERDIVYNSASFCAI